MGLFDEIKKVAQEKINNYLPAEGIEEETLNKLVPLAPKWVQNIIKNKEVIIPAEIIENKLKNKVKKVNITKDGILITANKQTKLMNIDVSFKIIITSINLKRLNLKFLIRDINIEKSKDANLIQNILTPILIPLTKIIIESIIKEKILNLSDKDILFKESILGENLELVCDFSNVEKAKLIKQKLPIVEKSMAEFVEVSRIEHLDNGVKIKFDIVKEK
ncbi:hypothetical protein [Caminibacter sp.]